jgi:hypothetical protein
LSAAAPRLAEPVKSDPAWYRKGGMITGGFVDAKAQADWPLWMQALVGGKVEVPAQELERADLYKVPDAFLVQAIRTLETRRIFNDRLVRQATAIGYTAQAAEWQEAKTAYQIAYLKVRGLPVEDPLTTSRLMTQMAYQHEFGLLRDGMKAGHFPPRTLESFLRMVDLQEGLVAPQPSAVADPNRPAGERLNVLMSLKRPDAPENLLASLRSTDVFDLAVFYGVMRDWISLDSPLVDEAIRVQKKPNDNGFWFLVRPEERVSDLLWMRAMDALKREDRKAARNLAKIILARYPSSWFAGHAQYLLAGLGPSFKPPPLQPLRVPGDITFFNAARIRAGLKPTDRNWPEAFRTLATRNRFDVILAEVDPERDQELFLRAAFRAGQQDLVTRYEAVELRSNLQTVGYLYPLFLKPMVERLIREEGLEGSVDAAFVLAMIKNESVFQPDARSGSDAFGIMQLLRPTFTHMAGLGADILDPETNIRAGLRYYKTVIRTAQLGSLPENVRLLYILAGYHAGEGRARRWRLANEASLHGKVTPAAMMLRIDAIPITTTKHYILRVLGDREIFKTLPGGIREQGGE